METFTSTRKIINQINWLRVLDTIIRDRKIPGATSNTVPVVLIDHFFQKLSAYYHLIVLSGDCIVQGREDSLKLVVGNRVCTGANYQQKKPTITIEFFRNEIL